MLDQRRAKEKGYITLREAADISNYAPDYIGQLIRSGKIKGEQVYCNVAWVTTEEEVRAYLENKQRTVDTTESPIDLESVLSRVLSYSLYGVIATLIFGLLFLQYILYVSFDRAIADNFLTETTSTDNS